MPVEQSAMERACLAFSGEGSLEILASVVDKSPHPDMNSTGGHLEKPMIMSDFGKIRALEF